MTRDRLISFTLLAALLGMTAAWWSQWRQVSDLRDALATSRRVVEQRNAMIEERDKIIQAWVDEHPPEGELMGANGRIIPDTKEVLARMLALLEKFDAEFENVRAGRTGFHLEGSLWKGQADVTLRKQP